MPKIGRIVVIAAVLIVATFFAISPAFASDRICCGDVTLDEDYDDDVYLTGENLIVNSTIDGDLIALGQTLVLNGEVTGDLMFLGQALTINGKVGDDLRAGGMVVIVEDQASIGDDVNIGVYSFEMRKGSSVGGDIYFGAGQMILHDVGGDVLGGASAVRLTGTIEGDVQVGVQSGEQAFMMSRMSMGDPNVPETAQVAPGLTFTNDAAINGNLVYDSQRAADIPDGAVAGSVSRQTASSMQGSGGYQSARASDMPVVNYIGTVIGSFIMLLVVGLLMQRFAPNFLAGIEETLRTKTLASLGAGILVYVLFWIILPIVAVLFIIFFILPLAGTGNRLQGLLGLLGLGGFVAFGFLTRWVSPIVVGLLLGGAFFRRRDAAAPKPAIPLAVGLFVLVVVMAIPFVGTFLITLLIGVVGLGAILLYLRARSGGEAAFDMEKTHIEHTGPMADRPAV
jgi:hypothetical protein